MTLSLRAVLSDGSSTEKDIEFVLNNKSSANSFSEELDKFDNLTAINFIKLLHSIADARRNRQDSDATFLSRCTSIGVCLRIMLENETVLNAFSTMFGTRFVGGFNALLGEVITINPDQEKDMPDVLVQFTEFLVELIPHSRGVEVCSLFFFSRILEFLAMYSRNAFQELPTDLVTVVIESFQAFLPHYDSLSPEMMEKLLIKIRPRSDQFLPILFESLFQIGDISFQSVIVLSIAMVGKKSEYRNNLILILTKFLDGTQMIDKLVDSFVRIFDRPGFLSKLIATVNFLHIANTLVNHPLISSLQVKTMYLNSEPLNPPQYSHSLERDASPYWCDFNHLTRRFSVLLADERGEFAEFLLVPPDVVKKVNFFSSDEPSRSSSVTLTLSELPEMKCLPKVGALRGGIYQLEIKCNKSCDEFLSKLKSIYPQEMFVELASSQPTKSRKDNENWDTASRASRLCSAYIEEGQDSAERPSNSLPKKPVPEAAVPIVQKSAPRTYGRRSGNVEMQSGDATTPTPKQKRASRAQSESGVKKSAARKSSVSAATRRSLDFVFSTNTVENEQQNTLGEKGVSDHDLPEITSSVYSASDYTRKLPPGTRKSVAFRPPSPIAEVTIHTEEDNEKVAVSTRKRGKKIAEDNTLGELDDVPISEKKRGGASNGKAKPLTDTPALPRKRQQRSRSRPSETSQNGQISKSRVRSAPTLKRHSLSKVDENESESEYRPSIIAEKKTVQAAVRKQPVRKAVLDAENRKRMETEQWKEAESEKNSTIFTTTGEPSAKKSSLTGNLPLFDESEFGDKGSVQSPPKRSRKSTTKKTAKPTASKSKSTRSSVSLEQQVEAAFDHAPVDDDLPSLVVEEGVLDENGRLMTLRGGLKRAPSSLAKKSAAPVVPIRRSAVTSPPLSIERMRQDSFNDFRPTDELNEIIDTNYNVAASTISPPRIVEKESNSSSQKKKNSAAEPTTTKITPVVAIVDETVNPIEPSPIIISRSANRSVVNGTNRANNSTGKSTNGRAEKPSSGTPTSWSESFPEEEKGPVQHSTPHAEKTVDPTDVGILTITERMVNNAVDHLTKLSSKGETLVTKIADANQVIRSCSEKLHDVELALSEYSGDVNELKLINRDLQLIREVLRDHRRSIADRRRVEEGVERIVSEIESGRMAENPAEFRNFLNNLLKSVGANDDK